MKKSLKDYYSKWNNYVINKIRFINSTKSNMHRDYFVQYVKKHKDIKSIVEVGAGELIEAQKILKNNPDIFYMVADISDTFLKYANELKISAIQCDMIKLAKYIRSNFFDLLYVSSVLEHSPNITQTIDAMSKISKQYYISMFKWRVKGGSLTSHFNDKRNYYTSIFSIQNIMNLLQLHSKVKYAFMLKGDGNTIPYGDYIQMYKDNNETQRDGSRMIFIGKWD